MDLKQKIFPEGRKKLGDFGVEQRKGSPKMDIL